MGSFRYDLPIPLAESDEDAECLVVLSFLITGLMTVSLSIVLILFGDYLSEIFNFEFLSPYYWLIGVRFFFLSAYEIIDLLGNPSKGLRENCSTKIYQSVSGQISKIILGLLSFASFGLILGELFGTVVGVGALGRTIIPKLFVSDQRVEKGKNHRSCDDSGRFPIYSLPAAFINVIALQAPILLLSNLFGFQTVGLYSLSYSMLVLPIGLVSTLHRTGIFR